jgi:hypothetical protein
MRLRPEAARWVGSPSTSTLRVSDAERNAVADKLSRHFADGRLDQSEFKERLDAAMSAKTQGDLAGLFDDLPPLASDPPPPPSRRRRLVPFLVMVAFVLLAAGSTFSVWHVMQVPWLLFLVVGFFVWQPGRATPSPSSLAHRSLGPGDSGARQAIGDARLVARGRRRSQRSSHLTRPYALIEVVGNGRQCRIAS